MSTAGVAGRICGGRELGALEGFWVFSLRKSKRFPRDLKREAELENADTMDAAQALALKERGNLCFKKGMFESAVELYTMAIECDSSCAVYYTNRALCYKKMGKWSLVLDDSKEATQLQKDNVKAYFLMGEALLHLSTVSKCMRSSFRDTDGQYELEEGLKYLLKARALSTAATTMSQEIDDAIHNGNKMLFSRKKEERSKERADLASFLRTSLETLYTNGTVPHSEFELRMQQLDRVFEEAEQTTRPFEVPNCLSCSISMAIMNDPVITPSGITYEKSLLLEHLRRNGHFDPITSRMKKRTLGAACRKPCPPDALVPNYGIKEAIKWFLGKYPWAYGS
ncbi:putative TPR domain-containing protein [Neospora caninum Liverpool]|uniref:E3 ubiquitin-protein ligase CHIP n=1 Tax=Neospora caninum (strain Liverpool) TaxID=572307 RepID=F0VBD0_NEOCL|nr:putative TPR domain-containing protein [Neospora caninum Liverpool]CBZ50914.1 putative TPR domain-containing protein [Neospora caninum Liverpool]CEL68216.1 TPA: TPR domain-containing protein, putative [Neospora caninum Liverpool]|eukprot:XP_003880947.1 putative TPR domain-containing protein [Neospora caninum Liverpool]